MKIIMIRHGETAGNLQKKYTGLTDEPLCTAGREKLLEAVKSGKYDFCKEVNKVFVSPMKRCVQTAEIVFSGLLVEPVEYVQVQELSEIDFGIFEGKTYEQLKDNPEYIKWLESNGQLAFPEGESREAFIKRSCRGFFLAVRMAAEEGVTAIAFVVHGGTIMAVLSSILEREYFDFQVKNGNGYSFELEMLEKQKMSESGVFEISSLTFYGGF